MTAHEGAQFKALRTTAAMHSRLTAVSKNSLVIPLVERHRLQGRRDHHIQSPQGYGSSPHIVLNFLEDAFLCPAL